MMLSGILALLPKWRCTWAANAFFNSSSVARSWQLYLSRMIDWPNQLSARPDIPSINLIRKFTPVIFKPAAKTSRKEQFYFSPSASLKIPHQQGIGADVVKMNYSFGDLFNGRFFCSDAVIAKVVLKKSSFSSANPARLTSRNGSFQTFRPTSLVSQRPDLKCTCGISSLSWFSVFWRWSETSLFEFQQFLFGVFIGNRFYQNRNSGFQTAFLNGVSIQFTRFYFHHIFFNESSIPCVGRVVCRHAPSLLLPIRLHRNCIALKFIAFCQGCSTQNQAQNSHRISPCVLWIRTVEFKLNCLDLRMVVVAPIISSLFSLGTW